MSNRRQLTEAAAVELYEGPGVRAGRRLRAQGRMQESICGWKDCVYQSVWREIARYVLDHGFVPTKGTDHG